KVIGNGLSTSFWADPWLEEVPLKDQFPRLFQVSIDQGVQVESVGRWDGGVWNWDL
ncbi:receptor-like kinase, partial [Trifolium medium]|nr:receptor-like kinase [Trifolium medium]